MLNVSLKTSSPLPSLIDGPKHFELPVRISATQRLQRAVQITKTIPLESGSNFLARLGIEQPAHIQQLPGNQRFLQMTVDRALLQTAEPGDVHYGFALPKKVKRFAN